MEQLGRSWAKSGAMCLTGRSEGPALGAPASLITLVDTAAATLRDCSGGRVDVDGLALLGERAALGGLYRQGPVSCGGGASLLRAADGWVAVSMGRPEDVAAFPAWLESEATALDTWAGLAVAVADKPTEWLDSRAALLGLPIAAIGSVTALETGCGDLPVLRHCVPRRAGSARTVIGARVIDLSSLWAGPLAASLLGLAGADVIKVESTSRPDGARRGEPAFFDLLNGTKRSVVLDLDQEDGRRQLQELLMSADVVVESARPRALEQMGIMAMDLLSDRDGPKVWASITSHGRGPGCGERVGFGDIAAAAGALVAWDDLGPTFLADAVTDPLAGLVAAAATLESLGDEGATLLDVGMAPMAAQVAGDLMDVRGQRAEPPRSRPVIGPAPKMGADTKSVLRALRGRTKSGA
jgi:CoA transferase family III